MDHKLREEFRAYKAETDDRIKRLEKIVAAISASADEVAAEKPRTVLLTSPEAKSK